MSEHTPILNWLANGRVGQSSKTMALIALGAEIERVAYPHDPDDLNRCLLLLRDAPTVRESFDKIAASCEEWACLIARWDEIESTFLTEVGLNWSHGERATKTYNLMESILRPIEDRKQQEWKRIYIQQVAQ